MTDDLGDRLADAIDGAASPVEPAEAMHRGKRQARRRATVVACVTVIAVAAAGVAVASATTGSPSGRQRIRIANPPIVIDRTWCVAVSRDDALAKGVVAANANQVDVTERAKLVTATELTSSPWGGGSPLVEPNKYWIIELRRDVRRRIPWASANVVIDASTGESLHTEWVNGPDMLGDANARAFDALPDHGSDCPVEGLQHSLVSAHIELPSTTIAAGSSESGNVVIENNSGEPLRLTTGGSLGCLPVYAVVLRNNNISEVDLANSDCELRPLVVAPGITKLPFTLESTYRGCTTGQPQGRFRQCVGALHGGSNVSPPLPAGDYQATFISDIAHFVDIAPVPVRVVSRS